MRKNIIFVSEIDIICLYELLAVLERICFIVNKNGLVWGTNMCVFQLFMSILNVHKVFVWNILNCRRFIFQIYIASH